ncbi:hypothetical protein OH687_15240 [Burkholderia anthina]|nr:hypothetical protein OH687_15240 [Burkholderia anthina]
MRFVARRRGVSGDFTAATRFDVRPPLRQGVPPAVPPIVVGASFHRSADRLRAFHFAQSGMPAAFQRPRVHAVSRSAIDDRINQCIGINGGDKVSR